MDGYQAGLQIENARKVARIETLVEDMHTRLFGDEDTGEIPKLKRRMANMERTQHVARGAFGVMSLVLSFIGWPYIRNLFK